MSLGEVCMAVGVFVVVFDAVLILVILAAIEFRDCKQTDNSHEN